jgi:hypothetical protein
MYVVFPRSTSWKGDFTTCVDVLLATAPKDQEVFDQSPLLEQMVSNTVLRVPNLNRLEDRLHKSAVSVFRQCEAYDKCGITFMEFASGDIPRLVCSYEVGWRQGLS